MPVDGRNKRASASGAGRPGEPNGWNAWRPTCDKAGRAVEHEAKGDLYTPCAPRKGGQEAEKRRLASHRTRSDDGSGLTCY